MGIGVLLLMGMGVGRLRFFGLAGLGIHGQWSPVVDELLLEPIGHRDDPAGGFRSSSGHSPCEPSVQAQAVHQDHVGRGQFPKIGRSELEVVGAYVGRQQALYSGRITGDVGRPRMDDRQRG